MLDARISALQEKIQSLDADIEALLMERIWDKNHTERYDLLIVSQSAEQTAAKQELADIKTGDAKLRREIQTLNKQAKEMTLALENTIIEESVMRRLIECIVIKQTQNGSSCL